MAETSRIECRTCRHLGAMHGPTGCRLNGCRCDEFAGPEGRRPDAVERALAAHRDRIVKLERAVDRMWVAVAALAVVTAVLAVVR